MCLVLRDNLKSVLVMVIVFIVLSTTFVRAVPSQRQTQELMLLDALGKKGIMGSLEHTQGTLIDMLGRSRLISF